MTGRPSKLTLVSIYAIVATIGLSRQFVRDVSTQLKNSNDDAYYYERNFLPDNNGLSQQRHRHQQHYNVSLSSYQTEAVTFPDNITTVHRARFPIRRHIVTQGKPRTATTLLFNMVAVSYFLYLVENKPEIIPNVELIYWQRPKGYKMFDRIENGKGKYGDITYVIKAHISLDNFLSDHAVIFTAASDKQEATEMKQQLEQDGHSVAFVQDLETVKQDGVPGLVREYVAGYGLEEAKYTMKLNEYFENWEILRQCCGQQMSVRWRNDMMPEKFKISQFNSHPTCKTYDIDLIEQTFMNTELYALIEKYPNIQPLNKPSLNDGNLNGTYCSSYNHLVRTQGLSIWGKPGGRATRTHLDGAIKDQMKRKRIHLKPEAYHLMPIDDGKTFAERLREMWRRPESEKKAWLKQILDARDDEYDGKTYEDYNIESTAQSGDDVDDDVDGTEDVEEDSGDDDVEEEEEIEDEDSMANSEDEESGNESEDTNNEAYAMENDSKINSPDSEEHTTTEFDTTHAIFLISFGKEAAESTLIDRCILSLRRRGAYDGYIVVLTDAPPERYQNEFDENVIVMHPLTEHLNDATGIPIKYTKDNTSLKSKRFKTFTIDYVGMDKRLDSVELIYYLDIDIMAGDAMADLFSGIENTYGVSRKERPNGLSKLYFFTPLSKEWPLQGGTFIVERYSSQHCLELWRKEIDKMTVSGRGRDQDGLRNIHNRIQSGEETECDLVRMKNENYIEFPTPRTFDKLVRKSKSQQYYPSLIHISNSVFAKRIDEVAQTEYIHEVLMLSDEEKEIGKYGKAIVHATKSDM